MRKAAAFDQALKHPDAVAPADGRAHERLAGAPHLRSRCTKRVARDEYDAVAGHRGKEAFNHVDAGRQRVAVFAHVEPEAPVELGGHREIGHREHEVVERMDAQPVAGGRNEATDGGHLAILTG